jgi:molecular chaperone GrpE
MTENDMTKQDQANDEPQQDDPIAAPEEIGDAACEQEGSQEDPLAAANQEIAKLKEQTLRAMAEAENTRRRMQKELEDTQKYAVSNFAKEMLTISDNFARALEAVPKDDTENETLKNLVTGVEAIGRQLASTFEKFGIQKVDPLGQPFDPHQHRVMMEQEDPTKPAGTVIQVFQPGYVIHGRLLREAMVVVSKGGVTARKVDQSA